jgi:hypothetical protein
MLINQESDTRVRFTIGSLCDQHANVLTNLENPLFLKGKGSFASGDITFHFGGLQIVEER